MSTTSDSGCGDPISSWVLFSALSYASPLNSLSYGLYRLEYEVLQPLATSVHRPAAPAPPHRKREQPKCCRSRSPPHVRSSYGHCPRPNHTSPTPPAPSAAFPACTPQRSREHVSAPSLSDSLTLVHLRNALHWGLGVSANTAALSALRSHASRLRLPTYLEPEVVRIGVPSRTRPAVLTLVV